MKTLFVAFDLSSSGGIKDYVLKFMDAVRRADLDTRAVELKKGGWNEKIIFVIRLFAVTAAYRPDVVICTNVNFAVPCYLMKVFFGRRYILNMYGVDAIGVKGFWRIRAIRGAERIVTLFDWTSRNIVGQFPEAAGKIFSIPNSVDESRFITGEKPSYLLKRHNISSSDRVVLTVARMSTLEKIKSSKGYDRVIKALPEVVNKIPNVRYVLVGTGDDVPNVQNLIRENGLEKYVIMPGAVNDEELVDYYNLCDVFVLPSKGEGFPAIALLEALACGKPVIGGNCEDGEKLLLYGKLGIALDPMDIGKISGAIVSILKNQAPKQLYGEVLRKEALGIYALEKNWERVKNLLNTFRP